jgi:hypothetical protein
MYYLFDVENLYSSFDVKLAERKMYHIDILTYQTLSLNASDGIILAPQAYI